jgi:hypothetical protein
MGTVTAEPKSKSKAEVSAAHPEPGPSAFDLEAAYGAPAGMPIFLAVGLQRKLAVGSVDDPLEREADQVAEQVMRMPDTGPGTPAAASAGVIASSPMSGGHPRPDLGMADTNIQRKCACGEGSSGQCEECKKQEEELSGTSMIHRRANGNGHGNGNGSSGGTEAPPIVHEALRSPGQPLGASVRPIMESRFGRDFSDVRVHTDSVAAQSAQAVNALAYTLGNDLVFAPGQYAPQSRQAKRLIAHELTHVTQQVSRTPRVQRQPAVQQGTDVGENTELPIIENVFAGKHYDRKSKQGALDYAKDWHTQFLRNYQPYMTTPYDQAPGDVGISFAKQQRVGRAFFIYTVFYWPQIQNMADTVSPTTLFQVIDDDVKAAQKECETEEESAKRIDPASYRTLFPETFAREYDEEVGKARKEATTEFENNEKWKVYSAQKRDKEAFILFGTSEYRPRFYADMLEAEAARIRKGRWSPLSFNDHKLFFWGDADTKGENVATAEWDAYIERVDNPNKAWTTALDKGQWAGDLEKQNKDEGDISAAEKDLVQLTIVASTMRNTVGREVLPGEVINAWNEADKALISIAPAVAKDELSDELQEATKLPVELFFEEFWGSIVAPSGPVENADLDDLILDARAALQHATNQAGWKGVFADYNEVVEAMDNYIAAELEKKGRKDEGEQLKIIGGRARALADLLREHRGAQKVRAVYYPEDTLQNVGEPGVPNFAAQGIQLFFYLYREDDTWNLADITTPQQVKVTSGSGGSADTPDMSIFSDVNSKLRFPTGRIYFYLPDGTSWLQECTEPWRLSEWLTWIGIGIAAIGLAIVTLGASIPAELIIIGGAVGVAAGVSDIMEKKRAGVLTTKDIAVDGLQIAASILTAGSAGLGKVVVSEAVAAGVSAAEIGGLAGKLFVPVTIAAAGTDITSFAVLTSDAVSTLQAIDKLPGSDEDRKMAKLRILAQLIGMGLITFLGVKGNISAARMGMGIHIGIGASGELSASALLSDAELLQSAKGMKNADDISKILANEAISQDLRDRIRAGLSQALTDGPIAARKLDELVARLRAATSPEQMNTILSEIAARSRIGALSGGEVAARVTPEEAIAISQLKEETLTSLKGASPRDLKAIAAVLRADPKEGARLVAEYGPEIIDYLRTNPLPSLSQLEDILVKQRAQVTSRVKGFAEGVDTRKPPEGGWKFDDGPGVVLDSDGVTKVIRTKVRGPNGAEGFFERAYNPVTKRLELRMAFLRMRGQKKALPSIIPQQGTAPEMIAGKGSPTVQYISVYQMKLLGVPIGEAAAGIRTIHMSDIQNVESIVHLHWLKQQFPSSSLDELIEFTASMKYAETTATQTGYKRSGRPSVVGGQETEIRELMSFQENGKPDLIAQNKALLDRYGFNRKTVMRWGFDIDFPVMSQP